MVLPFPILSDYALISVDGVDIYATHGHKFGRDNPPPLKEGDILLCGHTHVAADETSEGFRYINPGSVSIPKENTGHGYILFEKGIFTRKILG
jgi:predicted phosphodiesterase